MFLVPFGCCAWSFWPQTVRISSATLISSFPCSGTFLTVLIALRNISFSVVPLAADWLGVSLLLALSFTIPRNQALSLAADWSGALLLTTYSWYSSQDSKQSRHGLYLNQTVHHRWRFGDPHKKSGESDRHDYEIKVVNGN